MYSKFGVVVTKCKSLHKDIEKKRKYVQLINTLLFSLHIVKPQGDKEAMSEKGKVMLNQLRLEGQMADD